MTEKPSKLKVDATIIHFVDGKEVRCSFNSCRDKFVSTEMDKSYKAWAKSEETRNPWGYDTKRKIQAKTYFWKCKECGSKYANRNQNIKSARAYKDVFLDDLCRGSSKQKEKDNGK